MCMLYFTHMNEITIRKGAVEASIDFEDGMNVTSLKYRGIEVIECDEERRRKGATYAIPVLFPTPNRTAGGSYSFDGEKVSAVMHGYARHSAFSLISRTESTVSGFSDFKAMSEPYDIAMCLEIKAEDNSLTWIFSIENNGEKEFPFSLALHPFFRKDLFSTLTTNSAYEMEATEEKIPTGRMIRIGKDNGYDRYPVSAVDADTVYYSDRGCIAELDGKDFSLVVKGDDSFKHLVIYGNPGSSFICAEPQTGSTDFINLHEKGFRKEASLLSLKKGEKKRLTVDFCFR